jgi:hypothetical protein
MRWRSSVAYTHVVDTSQKSEDLQQPQDDDDDHNDVEDAFDLAVHGDVIVDRPENDANNDECDEQLHEGHCVFLSFAEGPVEAFTGLFHCALRLGEQHVVEKEEDDAREHDGNEGEDESIDVQ